MFQENISNFNCIHSLRYFEENLHNTKSNSTTGDKKQKRRDRISVIQRCKKKIEQLLKLKIKI